MRFAFSASDRCNQFPQGNTVISLLLLWAVVVTALPVHAAEKPMKPVTVPNPATSLWKAVREGQKGFVANPKTNGARLIVGIPRDDCGAAGNCTEQAVGFSLPIHALMPEIREPRGIAGASETIGFALMVFAGLVLAGLVFSIKLTKEKRGDATTTEGSVK
ncbi:MAG: hypothetical protein GY814_06345 [Gammaproteobacteria bacterium]|nr:hypothetical protein [Gammaproteobacteria bacterium]